MSRVSVVIATYNMGHLIEHTIASIKNQSHQDIEIIVYDDLSTDNTEKIFLERDDVRYIRGEKNLGVGNAFNEGIKQAKGQYVMLMCADDLLASKHVISDGAGIMDQDECVGYVTRWYYQFIGNDPWQACRAWRGDDPVILANNPSGLMFRATALDGKGCSNKMFIETSYLAYQVLAEGWDYKILDYDAVAVRVHDSTSREKTYWLKRRVSSPVLDWVDIGGLDIAKDYVSFIQIKNGFELWAVWEEIVNFAKVRPWNLLNPKYYFWAMVALITPRDILRKLPPMYRSYIGRGLTEIKKRSGSCLAKTT